MIAALRSTLPMTLLPLMLLLTQGHQDRQDCSSNRLNLASLRFLSQERAELRYSTLNVPRAVSEW